jgi:hypothetical protein
MFIFWVKNPRHFGDSSKSYTDMFTFWVKNPGHFALRVKTEPMESIITNITHTHKRKKTGKFYVTNLKIYHRIQMEN